MNRILFDRLDCFDRNALLFANAALFALACTSSPAPLKTSPSSPGAGSALGGGGFSNTGGGLVGTGNESFGGSTTGSGGSLGGTSGTGGDVSSAGSGGLTSSGGASSSGGSGGNGGDAATSTEPDSGGTATGIFPPVTDPGAAGPDTPTTISNTGPNNDYTIVYPMELGQNGVKNPIVIWGDGAVLTPSNYTTVINHMASHGFVVIAYNATPAAADMTAAIDYMVAQGTASSGTFAGKIDTTKIAAMGHSAGSLATFQIAADPRLTTTMHFDGGTMAPHTDNQNLRKPAVFICGDNGGDGLITGDVARPNCDIDFQDATTPVWYGDIIGASHLTIGGQATDPKVKAFLTAIGGWLRWQLAGDETMKALFLGSKCGICTDATLWTVQQKNL